MNTSLCRKFLWLITLSLVTNVLSSFNLKTDLTKTANNSTLPFWQQPHIPDYANELQKYKPTIKEHDKQQANDFIANAKQNVRFLENKGQMMDTEGRPVPFVLFKAEATGMNVYITEKGLTYVFVKIEKDEDGQRGDHKSVKHQDLLMPGKHIEKLKAEMAWINVNLKGATIKRENIIKEEQSAEHFNYFYGHCPEGIYDVYKYKKLTIKNVYPNIDWVFYNSSKGGMKYDFIVNPGANPNDIKLIYESETPLSLDEDGNLQLKTKLGSLTENAPYSYIKENTTEVKSSFKTTQLSKHQVEVAFTLDQSSYTQNSTLVIDPQLVWGTFYGGSGQDYTYSIESDSNGNVFVTGFTASTNFPLLNAGTFFQGAFGGAGAGFASDAFILKFTNSGNLLWATYYGGSSDDVGFSICTDLAGNVFVTGFTNSTNFPVQNAGTFFQGIFSGGPWDVLILKFDNNGNRLWATFYGGSNADSAYSICTDLNGNVFLTGYTNSTNFPVQNAGTFFQGIFGGGNNDVFILKFDNNGNRLWATYYGGSDDEVSQFICIDLFGNLFATGFINSANFSLQNAGTFFQGTFGGGVDAFILKFDNSGNRLWATFYGGSGIELSFTICTDSNGNVFVAGYTDSPNFPVQNAGTFFQGTFGGGGFDAFIIKFDNAGTRLWATYFGSNSNDVIEFQNLVVDNCDNVYLSLQTPSNSFPHLLNSISCSYFDNSYNGGATDFIIARFTNNGSLNWCTYLGGSGSDGLMALDIDLNNNLFTSSNVSGFITSATYSLVNPGAGAYFDNTYNGGGDVYILKFSPTSYTNSSVQTSGCGACDGSATFSITCGEAPYSYVWSNGTSVLNTTVTASSIGNLCPGVYNVTVTSACTQTVAQSYTIGAGGAGATPLASILPGNSICAGQNLTLTTGSATSYTWVGPNNFASNLQSPVLTNAQLANAGVYTLNVISLGGCVGSNTVNLVLNPPPTVLASISNSSACQGQSISLVGTSTAITFQWAGPNNYNSALQSPTLTNLQLNNAGVYTLNVTSASGCVNSATVSLVVNPQTTVTASASSTSACQGQSISLSGASTATTFQWSGPNNFSSALQSPTLTNLQLNNGGVYTLNVTSANSCVNSATVSLVVNPLPTVSASLSNSPCQGQNASLVATSNAAAFQWSGPNNFSSILQNPALTNLQLNNAGVYTLNVTSANGCVNSATVNLVVNSLPTVSASISTSIACQGQSLNLIGISTANAFQWAGPTNYTSALQSPTLTNLQLTNGGVYTLNVTSASGCVNSATVSLVVNPLPTVSASLSNSACQGQSLSLVGTSTATTFQWAGPNNYNSALLSPTLTNLQLNNGGVYTLNVTSANSCVNSATVNLVVNSLPTVSASSNSACQGQSLSLVATSNAAIFQWAGPNNFASNLQNPALTNLQLNNAGVYTLNVTSANGCVNSATVNLVVNSLPTVSASISTSIACQGQSLNLIGISTANAFQWAGPTNYTSALQSPTLTNLQLTNGGVYTLNVTSASGCVNSATVSLVVNPLPTVSASLSNSACQGQSLSLVGTSTATTFQWAGPNNFSSILQNPLFTNLQFNYNGVYILNVTSASGCFNSTSIILQVNPLPTVSASASSSSACQGQSVSLIASGNATVFQWAGPNNYNSTGQTVSIQNLQLNQSGVYNVSATSLQGCTNTTTVNFTVNPNPQAVILSQAVSACPPLCASYSFVATADVASYTWQLPDVSTSAINAPTVQTCYSSPGAYTMQLEVKGTNGCVAKGSYSLQVYPKPIADFVFNPTNPTVNEDDVVTFKDATGYGSPNQWAWHFLTETKNTITKFGNEATYKYSEAGTYPISLVVTNKFGCLDTVVKSIVVADDYGLFIPNAFTPNNDGVNDTFVPKGHGIKSYTLVIFDRWGEQIYKTNHFETGWDGYYKGELSKSDVYTWKINCVDVKNKSHELVGSVTLLN